MPPEWKKPRGRRHTPPTKVAIVHGMLDAGIDETRLLAAAAKINYWLAWSLKRKYLARQQPVAGQP
jgi:hypothetical protein